jgi:hypothetical protein
VLAEESQAFIFPAVHYVMPEEQMASALERIRTELDERVMQLRGEGKLLEAQRLLARTKYDLEMMRRWVLLGHRELQRPPRRAAGGAAGRARRRAAFDAGLLPPRAGA